MLRANGRILVIFSTKALIYTAIAAAIGLIFLFLFNLIGLKIVGIIITVFFALIGFVIGTFKMPVSDGFRITRKTGGENIDDIIKRAIIFYKKKNRIYLYAKEEKKDDIG